MKTPLQSMLPLLLLAGISSASVTVTSPVDGSTVSTTAHVVASSPDGAVMRIYVDDVNVYEVSSDHICDPATSCGVPVMSSMANTETLALFLLVTSMYRPSLVNAAAEAPPGCVRLCDEMVSPVAGSMTQAISSSRLERNS